MAEKILNSQMDIEEKKKRAAYVINNTGDIYLIDVEVDKLQKLLFYPATME